MEQRSLLQGIIYIILFLGFCRILLVYSNDNSNIHVKNQNEHTYENYYNKWENEKKAHIENIVKHQSKYNELNKQYLQTKQDYDKIKAQLDEKAQEIEKCSGSQSNNIKSLQNELQECEKKISHLKESYSTESEKCHKTYQTCQAKMEEKDKLHQDKVENLSKEYKQQLQTCQNNIQRLQTRTEKFKELSHDIEKSNQLVSFHQLAEKIYGTYFIMKSLLYILYKNIQTSMHPIVYQNLNTYYQELLIQKNLFLQKCGISIKAINPYTIKITSVASQIMTSFYEFYFICFHSYSQKIKITRNLQQIYFICRDMTMYNLGIIDTFISKTVLEELVLMFPNLQSLIPKKLTDRILLYFYIMLVTSVCIYLLVFACSIVLKIIESILLFILILPYRMIKCIYQLFFKQKQTSKNKQKQPIQQQFQKQNQQSKKQSAYSPSPSPPAKETKKNRTK